MVISTYQAGKLITVGTHGEKLDIRFHHFEQAMGIARTPRGIAVGTKRQIWFLNGSTEIAPHIAPAGRYDIALLAGHAHFTGPVMGHEMAQGDGELWFLNTLFSCICTLKPDYHFVPRWRPPFVTALASEDRCHLNGLAMENNRPRFDCPGPDRPPGRLACEQGRGRLSDGRALGASDFARPGYAALPPSTWGTTLVLALRLRPTQPGGRRESCDEHGG